MHQPLEKHRSGNCLRAEPSIAGFPPLTGREPHDHGQLSPRAFHSSFLPALSIHSVVFSTWGIFWKEEGGGLPLFPCPQFSPSFFLGRAFPISSPHTGNTSISSLCTINHRQTPLWQRGVRRLPSPLSLPAQAALQTDARGSPSPSPFAPVPARGKEEGGEQREAPVGQGERDRAAQHRQSP